MLATIASFITNSVVSNSFSDSISLSDSASFSVTGAVNSGILVQDYLNLQDAASTSFIVSPPNAQRGNIDYDQIRRSARSGDGAKLHTLTGSITTGHGVIFDAAGNLIDSGSAPGGSGTVTSVDMTVPSGFAVSGNPSHNFWNSCSKPFFSSG